MLYVPFCMLEDAADWGQFANPRVCLPPFNGSDDIQWWPVCFHSRLAHTPEIFPEFIRQLWRGNQAENVPNEDKWALTPEVPR